MKTIYKALALIRKGNQIFALNNTCDDYEGNWNFPYAEAQSRESASDHLISEMKSMLQADITIGKQYCTFEYDNDSEHVISDCYWCTLIYMKPFSGGKWITKEELSVTEWNASQYEVKKKLCEDGFNIKNLIFDVGEVLFDYRWKQMLADQGMPMAEIDHCGERFFTHDLWTELFDRGVIDEKELMKLYAARYPDDAEVFRWFIENAEEMPIPRTTVWNTINALKSKGYGIYILSNYSEYMFRLHTKDASIMDIIDGKVVSYEIRKIKPEPEIYLELMKRYSLKPEECLFFDDRRGNIYGSHAIGMDAVLVTGKKMLELMLEAML